MAVDRGPNHDLRGIVVLGLIDQDQSIGQDPNRGDLDLAEDRGPGLTKDQGLDATQDHVRGRSRGPHKEEGQGQDRRIESVREGADHALLVRPNQGGQIQEAKEREAVREVMERFETRPPRDLSLKATPRRYQSWKKKVLMRQNWKIRSVRLRKEGLSQMNPVPKKSPQEEGQNLPKGPQERADQRVNHQGAP